MNAESYGSYVVVFALHGTPEDFFQREFIGTLKYYKEQGEVLHAEISRYREVITLQISCTMRLYNRMINAIRKYFYIIAEVKMPREKFEVISHITKEDLKNKAKEYAEKTKQSAYKAGHYVGEHKEQIKKGAIVAAEVAPLII